MTKQASESRAGERFSSTGFIIAAIGSAVGLGNMWKFPYITGKYGGAAFFLVFIICLLLVGLPVLLAEMAIGRGGRGDAATSFRNLSRNKVWSGFGFLSIVGSFMILSFYAVVAGWTLKYGLQSFTGSLYANPDYAAVFGAYAGSLQPIAWQALVLLLTGWVVARGVSGGIESFNKVLIPGLLILLIILMIRGLTLPGAGAGVSFFLEPDFSKLTPTSILVALGHAFFSLSLGMGTMLTYGAYVDRRQSLGSATLAIGAGDLLYALLAGLIIFPTSFAFGLEPAQGPGLIFAVLPAAFASMPLGAFFGGLFFLLLAIAAITSTVSLLEVSVAYSMRRWSFSRPKATALTATACFLVGIPAALSVGGPLGDLVIGGRTYFDWLDFIASNIILPLGGLAVTLFVGYAWKRVGDEVGLSALWFRIWLILVRYVAPVLVVFVFLFSTGIFRVLFGWGE
ncbi:transporter [Paenibacillus sp. J31TS4]|uniref:sodium-dependent transporter n=1 Tax=Paenibacillus sp. J31TS4 TaxID=2807195 RepID=UPI001B2960D7|nr:sodium-dependent transporter [Paenibacillus sp. J31TS4]GIP39883.1 transporter [Paenibacillus sp. J31TS4]